MCFEHDRFRITVTRTEVRAPVRKASANGDDALRSSRRQQAAEGDELNTEPNLGAAVVGAGGG
ncbi:hypothetical protein GTS_22720 [Gandjariella thermophila]|uniref:Uncharacterized protein n=1 Tax=Gandjariella thermophila TaxID=1931992 RepID=A0A4D4J872_9PSEU|nr:hypothetical protein GTS_22720 [Gandjariella thermophila]